MSRTEEKEALEPLHANFIPRDVLLQFLREHAQAALRVAEILSQIYHATLLEVRHLGFSGSTAEKLARFLLDLPARPAQQKGRFRATLGLGLDVTITRKIGALHAEAVRCMLPVFRKTKMEIAT